MTCPYRVGHGDVESAFEARNPDDLRCYRIYEVNRLNLRFSWKQRGRRVLGIDINDWVA